MNEPILAQANLGPADEKVNRARNWHRTTLVKLWGPVHKSRVRAAAVMLTAVLLGNLCITSVCRADGVQPEFQKLFHLVGVPGLRGQQRVNLTLTADGLLFQSSKVKYQIPYARVHHVTVMRADRRYEGRTYLAAVATDGVGMLLILKKHHVDTVVLDYVNERGGKMGIVVQMERSQGEELTHLLKSRGVAVVEPDVVPESTSTKQADSDTERSKQ